MVTVNASNPQSVVQQVQQPTPQQTTVVIPTNTGRPMMPVILNSGFRPQVGPPSVIMQNNQPRHTFVQHPPQQQQQQRVISQAQINQQQQQNTQQVIIDPRTFIQLQQQQDAQQGTSTGEPQRQTVQYRIVQTKTAPNVAQPNTPTMTAVRYTRPATSISGQTQAGRVMILNGSRMVRPPVKIVRAPASQGMRIVRPTGSTGQQMRLVRPATSAGVSPGTTTNPTKVQRPAVPNAVSPIRPTQNVSKPVPPPTPVGVVRPYHGGPRGARPDFQKMGAPPIPPIVEVRPPLPHSSGTSKTDDVLDDDIENSLSTAILHRNMGPEMLNR